jgi:hypothetical protein
MSVIARQSTARTVMVGPVLDASGVAVTDGVVGDLKISKNGGAPAALNGSATLTHRNTGHYSLALTTSDLDTVGQAEIVIDDTVNAMPVKVITVIEEAVYDALFVASAPGYVANAPVNVAQFGGSNLTSASGIPEVKVASVAANAITATAIAADAITDAKVASDVTIASVTGAVGSVTGAVGSVTGSVGSVASGGITAASFGANAITAAKLDPDVTTELQAGLATASALSTVDGKIDTLDTNVDTLLTRITSTLFTGITSLAEWLGLMAGKQTGNTTARTEIRATGAGSGTYDETTDALQALRDRGDAAWITATGFSTHSAADVWAAGTRTLTAIDEDSTTLDLDATVRAAVGLASANLDTQLAALPTAGENADAVWEEPIADHSGTAGSTAEQLAAAGAAGDPWATALPGSYTSGQAGKIVGDNLNATVSSRASQTSVDDVPTNAELTAALASADDAVLAQVALVKAKTDLIPSDPAETSDIPSAATIATAVLNAAASNPIDANVQEINDVALTGDGSATPWGPA